MKHNTFQYILLLTLGLLSILSHSVFHIVFLGNKNVDDSPQEEILLLADTTSTETKVFAFMTEPRCIASAPFVLENALKNLPSSFPVVLFYSKHNHKCVKQWINQSQLLSVAHQTGRFQIEEQSSMDPKSRNIYSPTNWNNLLYTSIDFWKYLRKFGNTALTIQSDTLICSDVATKNVSYLLHRNIRTFSPLWEANFLGGVSWTDNVQPSSMANTHHLNGGLSVRKLDWVLKCLEDKKSENFTTPEDDIFCNCTGGVHSVSVVDAMNFASDNGHTKCFDWDGSRHCPWGVHKPWKRRWGNLTELMQYCPDIKTLHQLLQRKSI